jgi:hypothetical protein
VSDKGRCSDRSIRRSTRRSRGSSASVSTNVRGWMSLADGSAVRMRCSTSWCRHFRFASEPTSRCMTGSSTSLGCRRGGTSTQGCASRCRSWPRCAKCCRSRYGEPLHSIGFNLYRDGADSVAWHGDRHRHVVTDPIVAIVSVGCPRPLRSATAWGRAVTVVATRRRRPVRDGRCLSARLGAHGAEGPTRRPPAQHHVPQRVTVTFGPARSTRHGVTVSCRAAPAGRAR